MVEALLGAMNHAADLEGGASKETMETFTSNVRRAMHESMVAGHGTRDLCGPSGLTTEEFINTVAIEIGTDLAAIGVTDGVPAAGEKARLSEPELSMSENSKVDVDYDVVRGLFDALDSDNNGSIDFAEFTKGLDRLNILPTKQMLAQMDKE